MRPELPILGSNKPVTRLKTALGTLNEGIGRLGRMELDSTIDRGLYWLEILTLLEARQLLCCSKI
jgi:hypothetical protein